MTHDETSLPPQPATGSDAAVHGEGDAPRDDSADRPCADAERLALLEGRVRYLEDRLRRALADQDNLRKRFERDASRERADERARVATAFLPVLDSLDLALDHADADPAAIVDGVRSVRDQALQILSAMGFTRRDDTAQPFDPKRHEAVGVMPDDNAAPGTVLRVIRPGYGDGETQLRPASVVVAAPGAREVGDG